MAFWTGKSLLGGMPFGGIFEEKILFWAKNPFFEQKPPNLGGKSLSWGIFWGKKIPFLGYFGGEKNPFWGKKSPFGLLQRSYLQTTVLNEVIKLITSYE